jgi:hypothetical protein
VAIDEIQDIATLIAHRSPNFHIAATGAACPLAFDCPLGTISDFCVVLLFQELLNVVHVITVALQAPCGAE